MNRYNPDKPRNVRIITSPGRVDGLAGPAPVRPVGVKGILGQLRPDIIKFTDGTQLALWSDGSLRHVYPRRPAGMSGRQRRMLRKLGMRTMKYRMAHDMPLGAQS